MNLKDYQEFCQKIALPQETKEKEILGWGLEISGEAGDVAGCIKKTYIHKDNKIDGIKENLGDTMWYIAMICNFYGWDMNDIIEENVTKLQKRYTKGISFEAAARKGEKKDWNE